MVPPPYAGASALRSRTAISNYLLDVLVMATPVRVDAGRSATRQADPGQIEGAGPPWRTAATSDSSTMLDDRST
jgi:hypothetical protein